MSVASMRRTEQEKSFERYQGVAQFHSETLFITTPQEFKSLIIANVHLRGALLTSPSSSKTA
jgi:hypothetical protein